MITESSPQGGEEQNPAYRPARPFPSWKQEMSNARQNGSQTGRVPDLKVAVPLSSEIAVKECSSSMFFSQ